MIARALVGATLSLLLAVQIIRNAAVTALSPTRPERAAQFWPTNPNAEISRGMALIASASRARSQVQPQVLQRIYVAEERAPLDARPYLVRGVEAQLAGDDRWAERAFAIAQWRDPRSVPAAYFLAEQNLRIGNVPAALRQVGALARLAPGGATAVSPYLAVFARDRRNWPLLGKLFQSEPELRAVALLELAGDPASAEAVLALSGSDAQSKRQWLPKLLQTLVRAQEYERAYAIWARASGIRNTHRMLYDTEFRDAVSPAPFNWSLDSSTVGLAERQPGGRLHILFYGQEDGLLARQLVLLRPGKYRLKMNLLGDPNRAQVLSWNIRCDRSATPFASVSLNNAVRGLSFTVPAGCPAQWVELSGRSADVSQQSDVTISGLQLVPENPRD